MDIFTDKLSQKLTAQEIIKANTAADLEELGRLRNQAAEYSECLAKMKTLIDDSHAKLSKIQANGDANSQTLKKDIEAFGQLLARLQEQFDSMDKSVTWQLECIGKSMGEKIDQMYGRFEAQISECLGGLEENVHRECVKVYRNVQAAMADEIGKQGEALAETKAGVASVKGRLGSVFVMSIAAMGFSLAGVILQVLAHMDLLPF